MGNIFKKVIAGALAAVMTVTSLSISAFAEKKADYTISGYDSIDIQYKGNNENKWNKVYYYDWTIVSGSEFVTLDNTDEKTVTVKPKKEDNYTGTVELSCQKMIYKVFSADEKLGKPYTCTVFVDMSGIYFKDGGSWISSETRTLIAKVIDEDGNPVKNAKVDMTVKSDGFLFVSSKTDVFTAYTNDNGVAKVIIEDSIYEEVVSYTVSAEGYETVTTKVNKDIGLFHDSDKEATTTLKKKSYEVKFLDEDGKTVLFSKSYPYGTTADKIKADYDFNTVSDKVTAENTRKFNGWNANVSTVTANAIYTAKFSDPTLNKYEYSIVYNAVDCNGNDIDFEVPTVDTTGLTLDYGTSIPAPATEPTGFEVKNFNETKITEDVASNVLVIDIVPLFTVTTIYRYENVNGTYTDENKGAEEYRCGDSYSTEGKNLDGNRHKYQDAKMADESASANGTIGTENLTVIYVYNRKTYEVTFMNGEQEFSTATCKFGATIAQPAKNPTKADDATYTYKFAGWLDANGDGVEFGEIKVTDDVTYTADFTSEYIDYTVKFLDENGVVIDDYTITNAHFGDEITAPDVPEKIAEDTTKQYIVPSWNPVITDETTVTGNIEFKATYETKDKIAITWDFDNGTDNLVEYYMPDTILNFPADPTKATDELFSFEFIGWTSEGYEGAIEAGKTPAIEDITFVAQYTATPRTYAVKYVNGAEVLYNGTFTPANEEVEPTYAGVPTRSSETSNNTTTSYTFSKWNKSVDGNTITYSAEFTSSTITSGYYVNTPVEIVDDDTPLADKPTAGDSDTVLDIEDEDSALADNPGTGVGLGGIITGASLSLIVCAACVFGGKKKIKK